MEGSGSQTTVDRFDFMIFGASGFTGRYVVEEVIRISENNPSLTWAVAGRNTAKLTWALQESYRTLEKEAKKIPVIVADVSDEASIVEMCKKAKIVLNCVGPYHFYGEVVVKACIENNAHHVDISGEPQFLERMQLEYHDAAKEAGVYVIGSAGFDSIPCETGVHFLQENYPGDLSYVEMYLSAKSGPEGTKVNYGTWQSAIHGFAHAKELRPLREQLFPEQLPKGNFPPPSRRPLFYSDDVDGWCLPFPGSDKSVVTRTQHYLYSKYKVRPFQMAAYVRQESFLMALLTICMAIIFALLASFSFGRKLLENHPGFFSFGFFSKQGPTRQQIMDTSFTMTLIGIGHQDKLSEITDQHSKPPDTKMIVKVTGPDPGYIVTPICMVQSALVLLEEKDKLPLGGGVYSPGAAFYNTTIIDRLKNNGMNYVSGVPFKLEVKE